MAMRCSSSKPAINTERAGRPRVLLNLAITADGKIATANRQVITFGSRRDQEHLYELRATVDAVMCGAQTLRETHATLNSGPARYRALRRRRGLPEQPLRVVVSNSASVPANAPLWRRRGGPVVLLTTATAPATRLRRLSRLGAVPATFGRHAVDLAEALAWLRDTWNVRRLLCEGGGRLNAALFRAGLVDELHLTICPLIFGGATAPSIADGPWQVALSDAARAHLHSHRQHHDELFVVYHLAPTAGR